MVLGGVVVSSCTEDTEVGAAELGITLCQLLRLH